VSLKVTSNFKGTVDEIQADITLALETIAPVLKDTATGIVPVKTGNLKRSIDTEIIENTLTLGATMPYAPYVEYGTPKMAARPYLRPAIWLNKALIEGVFSGSLI